MSFNEKIRGALITSAAVETGRFSGRLGFLVIGLALALNACALDFDKFKSMANAPTDEEPNKDPGDGSTHVTSARDAAIAGIWDSGIGGSGGAGGRPGAGGEGGEGGTGGATSNDLACVIGESKIGACTVGQ